MNRFFAAIFILFLSISGSMAQGIGQSGVEGQAPAVPGRGSSSSGGSTTVYSVDSYGAAGNGTTDDYHAFLAAATACAPTGGTILIGPKKYLINSSNLTIPAYCTVSGGWHWPGNYNGGQTSYGHTWAALDYASQPYTIILNPTYSIIFSRNSGLSNLAVASSLNVRPTTLQMGVDLVNGFTGTALKIGDGVTVATGSNISQVAVWGFDTCLTASYPSDVHQFYGDCLNGIDIGTHAHMGDEIRYRDMQIFPWMTQNQSWTSLAVNVTGTANHGDGTIDVTLASSSTLSAGTSFHVVLFSVGGTIEANGGWTGVVNSDGTVNLLGSTYTNAYTSGGGFRLTANFRDGTGFKVGTLGCDGCGLTHAFEFGHAVAFHFSTQALYAYCWECNFDSPQPGDSSTKGLIIDEDASSITYSGTFLSNKGTGVTVDSTDSNVRAHTILAPRLSASATGATYGTGANAYALEVLGGNLTILGGYIANSIHIGPLANKVILSNIDAHDIGNVIVERPSAFIIQNGQWPAKYTIDASSENRLVNGEFLISQIGANASTAISGNSYIIDGWKARGSGLFADLTFQRAVTGGPVAVAPPGGDGANHPFKYTVTVASNATPTSTQFEYLGNRVEGNLVDDLGWGSATAKPVVVSLWLKGSVAGDYSIALGNSAQNRSYVTSCTLTADTWTYCSFVVPGDTSGTWLVNRNQVGIELTIDLGAGTDFQTATVGSWQAGQLYEKTGAVQLVANAAATLAVAGVRLRAGTTDLPYIPRPFGEEFLLARRYYQTSFTLDTAPATNAGVTGAVCINNPIANGYPSVYVPFSPPMMTTPTVSTFNPSASGTNWRDVTNAATVNVSVDPSTAVGSTGVNITTAATYATVPANLCIHYTASAAL